MLADQQTAALQNKALESQNADAQVQVYMKSINAGDTNAMCELASLCLNNKISNETAQQLSENQVFKTALNELARKYAQGLCEPNSDEEAFLIFKCAENQNDPDVLCAIGRAYHFGWGVEINVGTAVKYYSKAADAGQYEAMRRLRNCKFEQVDVELSNEFRHFNQLAQLGNATALFNTGFCYCCGVGVGKCIATAFELLQTAADNGCSNALVQLGIMYSMSQRPFADLNKARQCYKQAAAENNANAVCQLFFGQRYCGVDSQVVNQLSDAAMQGNAYAAKHLAYCYANGYGVATNQNKAQQYYEQAAIAGIRGAQHALGTRYYNAVFVQRNYKKATYWMTKCLAQKDNRAESYYYTNLAQYQNQFNRRKTKQVANHSQQQSSAGISNAERQMPGAANCKLAFCLAKLASTKDCHKALELIGDCYSYGYYVSKDVDAAASNYENAKTHDIGKLLNLVECYSKDYTDECELNQFSMLQRINLMLRSQINTTLTEML